MNVDGGVPWASSPSLNSLGGGAARGFWMADGISSVESLVRWGLIGGAVAGVVNVALHAVALYGLSDPMAGDGGMEFMAIPLPLTFIASAVPGAVAALVYSGAERLSPRPRRERPMR